MSETLRLPGVVDAHVHLREPGATHKEDILSGTRAALAGGVVAVLDMPNNAPPITTAGALSAKADLFRTKAVSDYGLFLGFEGPDVAPLLDAGPQAVGLKLYLDETFGDLTTSEPALLARVFEAWPGPGPIAVHAESRSIPRALELARRYGQRLHVCHVPHPDDLLIIEDARQAGVAVTCEVTPHHLFLTEEAVARLGSLAQMKPPLLPADLVERFWRRLDMVDIVASDHAPHTREEKASATPPPGVPGLETTLPLLLGTVSRDRLTLERMLELTTWAPLEVYGLRLPEDTWVDVDMGDAYRLPADGYLTRCGWSPFAGVEACGLVRRVRLRGQIVWEEGTLQVAPGYGRALRREGDPC